jgi:hypothetical protein
VKVNVAESLPVNAVGPLVFDTNRARKRVMVLRLAAVVVMVVAVPAVVPMLLNGPALAAASESCNIVG